MDKVNLAGGWTKFWNVISTGNEQIFTILTVLGAAIVVCSLLMFFWERRRGSGGNKGAIIGALILGVIFSAPQLIFPLLLKFVDLIINTVIRFLQIS